MTMATDSSKIKLLGRLLLPASLEEIGKACGGDYLLRRISDDSWALGIWFGGYSGNPVPDAILYSDGHLAVEEELDYETIRIEIERRLGANLPARGTA